MQEQGISTMGLVGGAGGGIWGVKQCYYGNFRSSLLDVVLHCIEHYERASGQLVNRDKSRIILPKRATIQQIHRIEHLTGFRHQQQPSLILECPCSKGIVRYSYTMISFIQKVRSRISGWASRLLSPGGRITLIRSVLSSIPLYLLQNFEASQGCLEEAREHLC
ncbi:Uncharacterized protein Adt_40073 [Abeliophyllum distichum]|uniref:Uncharacterized protein n=1 Tax=Abeliophyllum distichum TaxID=126358 RepID=A0ABD1Q7Z1_9LAMI